MAGMNYAETKETQNEHNDDMSDDIDFGSGTDLEWERALADIMVSCV